MAKKAELNTRVAAQVDEVIADEDKFGEKVTEIVDTKENSKSPIGRPSKYNPVYCELLVKHFERGGEFTNFPGFIYHYYKRRKGFKKAVDMCMSPETLYDWCNPESPRFKKEFSDTVKKYRKIRDYFWMETAPMNKNMNSSKYQLYMANKYNLRLRQDVTSNDEKIVGPSVYTPEKHKIVDGEVVEPKKLNSGRK